MSEQTVEVQEEGVRRRMPDYIAKQIMTVQGGRKYLPAAARVLWFRDELGDDWGLISALIEGGQEAGFATVQVQVVNPDGRVIACGTKTETRADFAAGWVEKAETGACSRALGFLGFGTTLGEMEDGASAGRYSDSPRGNGGTGGGQQGGTLAGMVNNSGAQCPSCHAPDGKPHAGNCKATGAAPTAQQPQARRDEPVPPPEEEEHGFQPIAPEPDAHAEVKAFDDAWAALKLPTEWDYQRRVISVILDKLNLIHTGSIIQKVDQMQTQWWRAVRTNLPHYVKLLERKKITPGSEFSATAPKPAAQVREPVGAGR